MICCGTDLVDHVIADAIGLTGQHLVAEEGDQRREVGLLVEVLVVERDGMAAQHRAHRSDRCAEAGALQMGGVRRDDLPPVRVQVDLGGQNCCQRADFDGLPDEGQFGLGEFLAGVAHHQQRIRLG